MPRQPIEKSGGDASSTDTAKAEKAQKANLTPEQRKAAVQKARNDKVVAWFAEHKNLTYVGEIDTGEDKDKRYVDITGNKGRRGHQVKDAQGNVFTLGPNSLQRGVEEFKAITGYVSPAEKRKAARAEAEAAKAAAAAAEPVAANAG